MKKSAIIFLFSIFALVSLCGCATTTTPQGSDADRDILDCHSYNFTVGVYDTDTDILYYCQFDT